MATNHSATGDELPVQSIAWKAWGLTFGIFQGVTLVWVFACFWSAFPGDLRGFLAIPMLLFGAWFVVLIHEVGHAAATLLCGWRVAAFAAGPLGVHLVNRRFALIPRSKRTEIEGFVLPLPTSAAVFTRYRNAVIDASGPAISLLIAAGGTAIGLSTNGHPETDIDPAGLALGVGALSFVVAVRTMVPIAPRSRSVDGQRVVQGLRMDDALWRQYRAVSSLHTLANYQVRLRDLPPWMIEEAGREGDAGADGLKQYHDGLIIGIALDTAPVDRARTRKLLDEFRANYGASSWLDSCDAYFTAIWEEDADRARARLWRGAREQEMEPLLLAAEAAVYARSGEEQTARVFLSQTRDAVRKRSIFPDFTFRDIAQQIEALLPA